MTMRAFGTLKRRNEGRWLLAGLLMATTAIVMIPKAEAQEASGLQGWWSDIRGISGDGTAFAGYSIDETSTYRAHLGYASGGMRTLPDLGGNHSAAMAINRDGTVVVGEGGNADGRMRAWRYVVDGAAGTMTDLGTLVPLISTARSSARGVSDDGARVVGYSQWQGNSRAFAWIEGATGGVADNEQMYALNGLNGGYNRTFAAGIAGDGRYAVGDSDGGGFTQIAVRWDLQPLETGGEAVVQNLGSLTGMNGQSKASAVSANGTVVVGTSNDVDGRSRAFRWREGATDGAVNNVQMLDLGTLGGQNADAISVTRDGNWVVGSAENEDDVYLAFRWSESGGMESIADWLARNGVTSDDVLEVAHGISDDGRVVVGRMIDDETGESRGYLARGESVHGAGLMDVEEYHQTLYSAAGGIASAGEFLTWLPMNGAHHRPLMMTPSLTGDMCAWATGDFAHHASSSTGLGLAEVGACTDLVGGSVRLGAAIGTTRSWQDMALGGSSRLAGQYMLGEVDWQPDGTPLLLSLTGMLGGWQANIDRAYSNGAATAVSSGETDAIGGVIRLRADWLEAARLGNTTINPWTSVSVGALHVDGYGESGGPFPAMFDAQRMSHVDMRLGLTAITEFSAQTKLSTTFEIAHRTGTAPRASGQVDGLFDFSLGGGTSAQTWVRAGAELDHKVTDHLSLSGSLHLASNGRDPSIAGSLGIKGAF